MTSPNATEVNDMTIPVASVPDSIHAGLRQEWVTAEADDVTATLTSGAGCGSSYMTLMIKRGDESIYETVDVRDFLSDWINAALERAFHREPDHECGITCDRETA